MGNQILGKRSRNFYRGFNERQLNYLKEKFQSLSEGDQLKRPLFIKAYQLNDQIFDAFSAEADFDESGGIDEYEFICLVSHFCNLTTEQLGTKIFSMLVGKASDLKQDTLIHFTSTCLKYNGYLQNKEVKQSQIKKANKLKFRKYDYDKNKKIDCHQFCKICMKDQDYKNWLFNMGFVTKNQMEHHDMIYDDVDSDIGEEVQRQLKESNPNVDRIKRGIDHRIQDDQFKPQVEIGVQSAAPRDKPWTKGLKDLGKAIYSQIYPRVSDEPPSQFLTLDCVLGYRSFDCRNNLRFDNTDQIVYHQAGLGIVLSSKNGQQSQIYLNQHKDDITCLDGAGDRIVTGEAGTNPMIIIWNSKNIVDGVLKSEFIITKDLKDSVGTVCLSPSQKLIAATCNDENHSLIVFNLDQLKQKQKDLTSTKTGIICSGPLTKSLVFDIKFQLDQTALAVATIRELLFVSIEKGVINSSRGDFGEFNPTMALSLLSMNVLVGKSGKKNCIISGMGNGSIYFWERGKCIKSLVGHTGSVSSMCKRSNMNSLVSGDKTGKIIFWSQTFTKDRTINLLKTHSPSTMVVALSHGKKKQLLIGTKGSNILLLNDGDGIQNAKEVMAGHSDGTIWAAAISTKHLYTGGEDQRLIKWDYRTTKRLIKDIKCPYKIRSIDHNAKNNLLAVGFVNGVIYMYNSETLEWLDKLVYKKIKNPDQQVLNIVKFQTSGRFLAVSYHYPQPKVIFFTFEKDLKLAGQIATMNKIFSFDLSKSSKEPFYLRCNTISPEGQTYDLFQFTFSKDKVSSKVVTDKRILRSEWATHTCPFTPETQSFYSEGVQEKDITCCARSLRYKNVVIAGDKYSRLKLFNYPCPENKVFNKYQGHSNAVTAMMFSEDEEYFISIGGEEKAIFIWKYEADVVNNSYVLDLAEEDDQFKKQQEIGVQSLSTNQYKGQIFGPRQFVANPRKDNKIPEQHAKIHHVFGIRSTYLADQVRNQGRFTSDGRGILFPTACMAVSMDIDSKQQVVMLEHKQDIVSFAVDSERKLMATGQMAQKNLKNPRTKILSIYVWDIQSQKSLVKLDGFHTIAVVLLEFSPSGKLLFSCGNDQKNSFAVYDWRAKTILYSGPVSRGKVNGITWKNQAEFVTCGNDHVKFWTNGKGKMGEFKPAPSQGQLCAASSGNYYITGGAKGNLFMWTGNRGPKCFKSHVGKIQCVVVRKNFVYSGGDDGKILRWRKQSSGAIQNSELLVDTRNAFPDRKLDSAEYGLLSLDFGMSNNDNRYFFITKGCAAVVSQSGSFKIVTQGHYKDQLWGLATNCSQDMFVTGGDDSTVRLWSIKDKEEIYRYDVSKRRIRGVDWSPDGSKIIFGDDKAIIRLLDTQLKLLSEYTTGKPAKDNKSSTKGIVEQIKFSPNSKYAVYGTHGKSLTAQFLSIQGKSIKNYNTFNAGTSAFLHADWSRDSQFISMNSQAAELLFFNIDVKSGNTSASSLRDEKWATWTQKLGFPVQGVFQGPDLTDINTVCRDPTGKFLAVGYDDQTIRLFKYPCYIPKQIHKTFYGHSSHLTRIRFTPNYMVSIGGLDRTIIVWQIDRGEESDAVSQVPEDEDDALSDLDEDVDLPQKIMKNRQKKNKKVQEQFKQIQAAGDQFLAVKPWLGAIKEPTLAFPRQSSQRPNAQLQLQYVHGYRVKDCRQNLFYQDDKTLIFHAAAVLIYHDVKTNSQKLLTDHRDDILSIDYHKPSQGVVTGEVGPKPLVNYYRNAKLIHSFKAPVTKGVLALAISPDGTKAVAAGMDDQHYIAVMDLQKGSVLAKSKGSRKVILKVGWVSDSEFVTVGIRHFKYWSFDSQKLKGRDGNSPGSFVSLAIGSDKTVLTGASKGTIYSWKGNSGKPAVTLKKPFIAENQQDEFNDDKTKTSVVDSISIQKQFIAAGTKDGFIFILTPRFEVINCINLNERLQSHDLVSQHPAIRSLDFLGQKMLIGTFGSEIYELQADNITDKNTKFRAICHMKNHYSPNNSWTNQVWGLHVEGDFVFSCSDDATLRCWSIRDRVLLGIASLNLIQHPKKKQQWIQSPKDNKTNDFYDSSKGRSVAISPDQKFIIVGCKEGTVRIFTFETKGSKVTMKMFQKFRHAKEWVSQIKFGFNMLIVGSHDNGIYVYDYEPEAELFKRKYRPMKKHSSYITHCDVSRDSCYLQSTCGAYQLLFWDLNTGKQMTSGASMLRDQRWATWTSTLGWPVQGIYPKCTDGTFIHSVDRSHTSIKDTSASDDLKTPHLLAAGNNNGQVCLYSYPCTIKNSGYVSGVGHSSHITNVRWTQNDDRIISVGGEDQCVMYWRVKKSV